ncbi:hypothetical protein ADILRU_1750 [Leifsonia rubra CMS 76R]|nr:hypothetical protein ADILRU_1750 [Leifsonia rubra CMS 76R]
MRSLKFCSGWGGPAQDRWRGSQLGRVTTRLCRCRSREWNYGSSTSRSSCSYRTQCIRSFVDGVCSDRARPYWAEPDAHN